MSDQDSKKNSRSLPYSVWPAQAVPTLEQQGADVLGITLYELMLRAGQAAYNHLNAYWPDASHWLILCGHGNNGGDGYVVARLGQAAGKTVTLLACESEKALPEEAQRAREAWLDAGGEIHAADAAWPERVDVIVDALLGTGCNRAPGKPYVSLIQRANAHAAPILAIDMPSGLSARNGTAPGEVINASHTLSMVALKPGQITGKARDYIGQLCYADLGLATFLAGEAAPIARYDALSLIHI